MDNVAIKKPTFVGLTDNGVLPKATVWINLYLNWCNQIGEFIIAQKEKDERLKSISDIYKEFIVNHNKKINELNKIYSDFSSKENSKTNSITVR